MQWEEWTCLQGRNRDAAVENGLVDTGSGRAWDGFKKYYGNIDITMGQTAN